MFSLFAIQGQRRPTKQFMLVQLYTTLHNNVDGLRYLKMIVAPPVLGFLLPLINALFVG